MSGRHDDVTVVITCFNYGRYLPEAIASALEQDGGPPRVIVVDDGSTEPATVAALEHVPPGVQVIRQENAGPSAARNTGVRASETRYVLPLDADDQLAPGALRALHDALEAEPDAGWAYGGIRFIGDWTADSPMPPFDPYRMLYRSIITYLALIRRELFDDVGGHPPRDEVHAYEDWDFWLSAVERGWRGVKVDAVAHLYRRHGETRLSGARADYRDLYRRIRSRHAALYARRAELAKASDLGVAGRLLYRFYWGPRPIPARLEHAIYSRVFRR